MKKKKKKRPAHVRCQDKSWNTSSNQAENASFCIFLYSLFNNQSFILHSTISHTDFVRLQTHKRSTMRSAQRDSVAVYFISEDLHKSYNISIAMTTHITEAARSEAWTAFACSNTEIVVRILLEAWMFLCIYSVRFRVSSNATLVWISAWRWS
jgi:hypothetical protein